MVESDRTLLLPQHSLLGLVDCLGIPCHREDNARHGGFGHGCLDIVSGLAVFRSSVV
jgi:hypothetical protein